MRNTILIFITILLLGGVMYYTLISVEKQPIDSTPEMLLLDTNNATFTVEGKSVTLVDGSAETKSPDGVITLTQYFGNELSIDLDGDGRVDEVFLVTQEKGGSGTFFYLVGALNTEAGLVGTEAVFIGDRIAPQTTEAGVGTVVVNYADRAPGEPFTTTPSVGKSIVFTFDHVTKRFTEVVEDVEEGEDVDDVEESAPLSLQTKTWEWVSVSYSDGSTVTPKSRGVFTLTFNTDGSFSAATDCNGVGGSYVLGGQSITFSDMMSTLMYCEDSQESTFTQLLTDAVSYDFVSSGELILNLTSDSGTVTFQ